MLGALSFSVLSRNLVKVGLAIDKINSVTLL